MFGLLSGLREEVISFLEFLNSTGHSYKDFHHAYEGVFLLMCICACHINVMREKNHNTHDLIWESPFQNIRVMMLNICTLKAANTLRWSYGLIILCGETNMKYTVEMLS